MAAVPVSRGKSEQATLAHLVVPGNANGNVQWNGILLFVQQLQLRSADYRSSGAGENAGAEGRFRTANRKGEEGDRLAFGTLLFRSLHYIK